MPFVNFRKKFRFFSFNFRQNFDVRTFPRWLSIRGTKFFCWDIQKIFVKIFTFVLLDGFLDGFWKFRLFTVKFAFKSGIFEYFSKITACVCWAYAETILSHAEHTRNRFHRTLSIRGTNFRACSASCKFTCTIYAEHTRYEFYRTLSIRGTNFRACLASCKMWTVLHVQYMLCIRGTNFIAHWAYAERISSHAEHMRNRFHRMLSMRGKVEYLGRIEYDFQKSRVTGPWDHMVSVSAKKVKKNVMLVYL
jgi:hypothetical protein